MDKNLKWEYFLTVKFLKGISITGMKTLWCSLGFAPPKEKACWEGDGVLQWPLSYWCFPKLSWCVLIFSKKYNLPINLILWAHYKQHNGVFGKKCCLVVIDIRSSVPHTLLLCYTHFLKSSWRVFPSNIDFISKVIIRDYVQRPLVSWDYIPITLTSCSCTQISCDISDSLVAALAIQAKVYSLSSIKLSRVIFI